jgi:hypothetical protein
MSQPEDEASDEQGREWRTWTGRALEMVWLLSGIVYMWAADAQNQALARTAFATFLGGLGLYLTARFFKWVGPGH